MLVAHRGVCGKRFENRVEHIRAAHRKVGAVEVDVRYNSNRQLVLCHDKLAADFLDTEPFHSLVACEDPMNIMLDMKPCGGQQAVSMAEDVCRIIEQSHHDWKLCSFDQRCVDRLVKLDHPWDVGMLSSGVTDWIMNEPPIDFVGLDHESVDEADIDAIQKQGIEVYLWVADMWGSYPPQVDGLIKNYVYADLSMPDAYSKASESIDDPHAF